MSPSVADMAQATLARIKPAARKPTTVLGPMQTPSHSIFRDNFNKMARTVILHVDGLDDLQCRRAVEQQLLGLKGVVSFTFDMKASRVTIRVRDWVKIEVCV